jgi:nicotinamidase-related amidase
MSTIGAAPGNRWTLAQGAVDLVRTAPASRPARLACEGVAVTFDRAASAIVVIDMQNAFCHPDRAGADGAARRPIAPLARLLPALRDAHMPVVWLNWGNRADGLNLAPSVVYGFHGWGATKSFIVKDSFEAAVVDGLEVDTRDIRIDKCRISGFWDTALDSILRNLGIRTLFFAGVNLDQCVYATLMDAGFLGYDCILLEDCCATSSPDFCTQATLWNVREGFGFLSDSDRLVGALAGA